MSKRISFKSSKNLLGQWVVNIPASISLTGIRQRNFFKTKGEADTFCLQQRTRVQNHGAAATILSPGDLEQAAAALEAIKPFNVSLNEVVQHYLNWRRQMTGSIPFNDLFNEFLKAKADHSKKYLHTQKQTQSRFAKLAEIKVSEITSTDLEKIMEGFSASVWNSFLRNLRAVFNFGLKRNYLTENPASKLDFVKTKQKEVVTLTPKEAGALMAAAASDLELLPYHAIGLFAGVRPNELERLKWEDVDLKEKHIQIKGDVSKTGRRRIITIEDNLKSWLTYYIQKGGVTEGDIVSKKNLRKRLDKIREAASLEEWHQDVMRHSYASYWLAKNTDINKLTLYMGHETTKMLWKHYHKAVKKTEADAFWKIRPNVKRKTIKKVNKPQLPAPTH